MTTEADLLLNPTLAAPARRPSDKPHGEPLREGEVLVRIIPGIRRLTQVIEGLRFVAGTWYAVAAPVALRIGAVPFFEARNPLQQRAKGRVFDLVRMPEDAITLDELRAIEGELPEGNNSYPVAPLTPVDRDEVGSPWLPVRPVSLLSDPPAGAPAHL